MKVTIAGGGVAGLAVGWRLAQAGVDTTIVERGICGRGATWAAAGMLAATAETGASEEAHAVLAREARAQWPAFAADVEHASAIDIDFQPCGALMVAQDEARAAEFSALAEVLRGRGERSAWLLPHEARAREPLLAPGIHGALLSADDARVDNRALGQALSRAFERAGGRLRECCTVKALHVERGEAKGVLTSDGALSADCVVFTAGAWVNRIGGAEEALPPIAPVKGQMTALVPTNGSSMPRHLVWGDGAYLVPGRERLLAGATVEDAGFDTSVTRCARDALVGSAVRLLPQLADWSVTESWAGLRPRAPDEAPVLGKTAVNGLFVAGGQFRNGILYAPTIAGMMRDLILGRPVANLASAFDPRRFAKTA